MSRLIALLAVLTAPVSAWAGLPIVSGGSASDVTGTTATFHSTVNPNGEVTSAFFVVGTHDPGVCSLSFGRRVPSGGTTLGPDSTVPVSLPIVDLTPGMTHFACAAALNDSGSVVGAIFSFTTPPAPTVATGLIRGLEGTTATLVGNVTPRAASQAWFRYDTAHPGSCSDGFGVRAPATGGTSLAAGTASVEYAETITGLVPGATYYYCAIASNWAGTSFGMVRSFTVPRPPSVTSTSVTQVMGTSARPQAQVVPHGGLTRVWFRFDTTAPATCNDAFGTRTPLPNDSFVGSGHEPVSVISTITGLEPVTTYHFCAIAENPTGTSFGEVQSFTTTRPPDVVTVAPSFEGTSVTLRGTANPNGYVTDAWIYVSNRHPGSCSTSSYKPALGVTALGNGILPVAYTHTVNLQAGVTFFACASASSPAGTSHGEVLTFTVPNLPHVTTEPATNIKARSATLQGTALPSGAATKGWFRYGTTHPGACHPAYGVRTSAWLDVALGAGEEAVPFELEVSTLQPRTTYYVCAFAANAVGERSGTVQSFTTLPLPSVWPTQATDITDSSATLLVDVAPNGMAGEVWFRLSVLDPGTCNDTFGWRAPQSTGIPFPASTGVLSFTQDVTLLSSGMTYYACAIASNAAGITYGPVRTFQTPGLPSALTLTARNVTSTSAVLNAYGIAMNAPTIGWFRHDSGPPPGDCTNTASGTRTPATGGRAIGSGADVQSFSEYVSGLTPGTDYFYCAYVSNRIGEAPAPNVVTFSTPGPASVDTLPATGVLPSQAMLQGSGIPHGFATTAWFRVGTFQQTTCNDTLGTRVPAIDGIALGSSLETPKAFSAPVTQLRPGTTYRVCAVAENSQGKRFGPVREFTTPSTLPVVDTEPPATVSGLTATVRASVDPSGADSSVWFRFGTSPWYPASCDVLTERVPAQGGKAVLASSETATVSEFLTRLQPGTRYYYCAVASNVNGTSVGAVYWFDTPAAPAVTTQLISQPTEVSAVLNGNGLANGEASTGWFRVSTSAPSACNDTFGRRIPETGGAPIAGPLTVNFNFPVDQLTPGTKYHYCAIAANGAGTSFGEVLSFSTHGPPTVTTLDAIEVLAQGATLRGEGKANGFSSIGWFRVGTFVETTCDDTRGMRIPETGGVPLGVSGTSTIPFARPVTGLRPGTTYRFCAVASSSRGTTFGPVLSFTTPALAPLVETSTEIGWKGNGVTLAGTLDPRGEASTGWFRIATARPEACDDTFGERVPATGGAIVEASQGPTTYDQPAPALEPGTTYYFCALASNGRGLATGSVQSFVVPTPPDVAMSSVSDVSFERATANASAKPNGAATTAWFRFANEHPGACDDLFGQRIPESGGTELGAGWEAVAWSAPLDGLAPETTYFVCALASNVVGTSVSEVLVFETGSAAPNVATLEASDITGRGATLHAGVVANGTETGGWFRYVAGDRGDCDDTFGLRVPSEGSLPLGSGRGEVQSSVALSGLLPNSRYTFCALASNLGGATTGDLRSFTTATEPPTVRTLPATLTAGEPPVLRASINPNGSAVTAGFRLGTERPERCDDAFGRPLPEDAFELAAGHDDEELTHVAADLPAGTYFYCAVASGEAGAAHGEVSSFEVEPTGAAGGCGCTSASAGSALSFLLLLAGLRYSGARRRSRSAG